MSEQPKDYAHERDAYLEPLLKESTAKLKSIIENIDELQRHIAKVLDKLEPYHQEMDDFKMIEFINQISNIEKRLKTLEQKL